MIEFLCVFETRKLLMATDRTAPPKLGVREQNKREKRERIRAAARELFSNRGYDRATLRQIAKKAHVGLGTLFNYAQDKRDFIFLIFNEDLAKMSEEAVRVSQEHEPLIEQLIGLAKPHYEFFAKTPTLSRILLRDMTFYSEGRQADEFYAIRGRLLGALESMILSAQMNGQIQAEEDPSIIARHFFIVYSGALRWWIASPNANPRQGLTDLRRLLKLQINGLHPKREITDGPSARSRVRRKTASGDGNYPSRKSRLARKTR
jgi:AcrR family transcriptional regulator